MPRVRRHPDQPPRGGAFCQIRRQTPVPQRRGPAGKGCAVRTGRLSGQGQLRTFCLGPSGDEISLFYLGPGNLFGSSALVYHAKVMVSVSAISPAEVYLLAADRFWKLWQEHGYPPQDLMAHFVRRITMLSDYICCSHFLEDDKRVAYFLHTCCASSGPSIPYTHEQIAAITGMSRVSVTRILKQFREAGILRQSYRRIEILAPQRLSEVFASLGYFLD